MLFIFMLVCINFKFKLLKNTYTLIKTFHKLHLQHLRPCCDKDANAFVSSFYIGHNTVAYVVSSAFGLY